VAAPRCAGLRVRDRGAAVSVFAWQTTQYSTLDAYRAALMPFKVPSWIKGITLHHSLVPTRAQWRGYTTMEGTKQYYIDKGWSAGPHLFLAADVPHIGAAGIWAGTPLAVSGIHAGGCNPDHIGIEIVGDYDREPWTAAVSDLVYGVTLLLMDWADIAPAQVLGHRECLPNKSCPGTKINMDTVRSVLAGMQFTGFVPGSTPPPPAPLTNDTALLALPRATQAQCAAVIMAHEHGEYTAYDVASIVRSYYAHAAGLDPLIAIAQMCHETGYLSSQWAARPNRNPAGIGVTGEAGKGLTFATWELSARAHIGRLLAYALPAGQGTAEQQQLFAYALGLRSLPAAYRGSAPVVGGLNGRWAPSSTYTKRILEITKSIMGAQ
jgi:hypothetical protein